MSNPYDSDAYRVDRAIEVPRNDLDTLRADLADARSEVERLTRAHLAADQARVAAEVRAEGLRRALKGIQEAAELRAERGRYLSGFPATAWECAEKALAAPPADLGLLRELARAVRRWDDRRLSGCQEDIGNSEMGLMAALDTLLAAYPWLDPGAEPAGEVSGPTLAGTDPEEVV